MTIQTPCKRFSRFILAGSIALHTAEVHLSSSDRKAAFVSNLQMWPETKNYEGTMKTGKRSTEHK